MFRIRRSLFRLVRLALAASLVTALTLAQRAHDFLNAQDFQSAPPQLTGLVDTWVDYVKFGTYERQGPQPFSPPTLPGMPADVTYVYIDIDGGGYVKANGCLYVWRELFVWIKFSDGSAFTWWRTETSLSCPDGSVEEFEHVGASAGVEDPISGAWSGWIRSYSRENLNVQRRASARAATGASCSLGSLASLPRPVIGLETTQFDLTIAPGASLDLRGLDGVAGPLFVTNGPVLIRCDTVLLDPGVQIADLFSPAPILTPSAIVHEIAVVGRRAEFLAAGPSSIEVRLQNLGNVDEPVTCDWIDVLSWSFGGPVVPTPAPMASFTVQIPTQVPPFIAPATESVLQFQASFAGQSVQSDLALVRSQPSAPPTQTYCTGKVNSLGCTPQISSSGAPTLSGYDDFVVRASDVLPQKSGLLFFGFQPTALPFQGGVKCIQSPTFRSKLSTSSDGHASSPCDGGYAHHMDLHKIWQFGFSAGQNLYAQWWMRDPQAAFSTGLSDALAFQFGL